MSRRIPMQVCTPGITIDHSCPEVATGSMKSGTCGVGGIVGGGDGPTVGLTVGPGVGSNVGGKVGSPVGAGVGATVGR